MNVRKRWVVEGYWHSGGDSTVTNPPADPIGATAAVCTVYLDANVLQVSVKHRPGEETREISWGGKLHRWTAKIMVPWEPNTDWLREQAAALPRIAEHARRGRLKLMTGPEVRHETWFLEHGRLPWTDASVFAGLHIEFVKPPFYLDRILIAYDDQPGDAAARLDAALSRSDDERFNELKKAAGGNKDADAYHLRCAEHANAEYFLTTDKRLRNSLLNQKAVTLRASVVFPTEFLALLGG